MRDGEGRRSAEHATRPAAPFSPPCCGLTSHVPVACVLPNTQADKNTAALQELNDFLLQDERISFSLVPVGDGIALCTKR